MGEDNRGAILGAVEFDMELRTVGPHEALRGGRCEVLGIVVVRIGLRRAAEQRFEQQVTGKGPEQQQEAQHEEGGLAVEAQVGVKDSTAELWVVIACPLHPFP